MYEQFGILINSAIQVQNYEYFINIKYHASVVKSSLPWGGEGEIIEELPKSDDENVVIKNQYIFDKLLKVFRNH